MIDTAQLLKQFDPIEQQYRAVRATIKQSEYQGSYVSDEAAAMKFRTMVMACITRVAGSHSAYAREAERVLVKNQDVLSYSEQLYGIIGGLQADVEAGNLSTLRALIHADVFSDLLETARYFLDEGHKDPAAVITGGVLEGHLRQLCAIHSVDTEYTARDGSKKPKMGDAMNNDLAAAGAYGKLDQKQVLGWLDLRNKAAHGQYTEYDKSHVSLFLQGVGDFITRFPA